jgi:hypothetical protein
LEEHIASIFRVEEEAKQETIMKQTTSILPDYTALYPGRYNSSQSWLRENQSQNFIIILIDCDEGDGESIQNVGLQLKIDPAYRPRRSARYLLPFM